MCTSISHCLLRSTFNFEITSVFIYSWRHSVCLIKQNFIMAGHHDQNPFSHDDDINPFSVRMLLLHAHISKMKIVSHTVAND